MPGGPTAKNILLEQKDVSFTREREVVGNAGPDNSAAHDNDPCALRHWL